LGRKTKGAMLEVIFRLKRCGVYRVWIKYLSTTGGVNSAIIKFASRVNFLPTVPESHLPQTGIQYPSIHRLASEVRLLL
jgi:hypothetical protein